MSSVSYTSCDNTEQKAVVNLRRREKTVSRVSRVSQRLSTFLSKHVSSFNGITSASRPDTRILLDDNGSNTLDTADPAYREILVAQNRLSFMFSRRQLMEKLPEVISPQMSLNTLAVVEDVTFIIFADSYELIKVTGCADYGTLEVIPLDTCKNYRFMPDDIKAHDGFFFITGTKKCGDQVRNSLFRCDIDGNITYTSKVNTKNTFRFFDIDNQGNIITSTLAKAPGYIDITTYGPNLRRVKNRQIFGYDTRSYTPQFVSCAPTRDMGFIAAQCAHLPQSDDRRGETPNRTEVGIVAVKLSISMPPEQKELSSECRANTSVVSSASLIAKAPATAMMRIAPYHFDKVQPSRLIATNDRLYFLDSTGELCYVPLDDIEKNMANCFSAGGYPRNVTFKASCGTSNDNLRLIDVFDTVYEYRL